MIYIEDYKMEKSKDCLRDEYNFDHHDDIDEDTYIYLIEEYVGDRAVIMPPDIYNEANTVTIEKGHILKASDKTQYMIWLKRVKEGIDCILNEADKDNQKYNKDSNYDYHCMILKNSGDGFKILRNEVNEYCYSCNIVLDYEVSKRIMDVIYNRQNVDFVKKLYEAGKSIGDLYYEAIIDDDADTIIELETECGFPTADKFDNSPDPFIRDIIKECKKFHSDRVIEHFSKFDRRLLKRELAAERKSVVLIGCDVKKEKSILEFVISKENADIEVMTINYDDFEADLNKIDSPNIVVFTDFKYKFKEQYYSIKEKFSDKKTLLYADNDFLFGELALADNRDKVSYSVDTSWRTFSVGDKGKDERGFKCEYYSPKYSRGFKLYGIKCEDDIRDILLVLSICEMLKINIYSAAHCLKDYYDEYYNSRES